jgi:hypothetical protein
VFQDGSVEAILARSSEDPSDRPETFGLGIHLMPYSPSTISSCPVRNSSPIRLDTQRVLLRHNYSSTASFSTISSLLTLFSKFFSSFLRSTCMLSVSYKYLALEEVYLLIRAAFPNYPTLRKPSYASLYPKTGLSPSMVSFSKELMV